MEPVRVDALLATALGAARRLSPAARRADGHRPLTLRRRPGDGRPADVGDYPGDFTGDVQTAYAPAPDAEPDPGEVVWAWVPYEEDHRRGKDRPVLVIGRDGRWVLGLPTTSKDHDRDADQEARAGRLWMDIGGGDWDPRRRPSEVRLDRIVRLAPDWIRRQGAAVDRRTFERVVAAVNEMP